jgi:hypothetical protein
MSPKANPGSIGDSDTRRGDVVEKWRESIQTLDRYSLALHLDSVFAMELWRDGASVCEGNQGQNPEDAL